METRKRSCLSPLLRAVPFWPAPSSYVQRGAGRAARSQRNWSAGSLAAAAVLSIVCVAPPQNPLRPAGAAPSGYSTHKLRKVLFASLQKARSAARVSLEAQWEYGVTVTYLARVIRGTNPEADAEELAAVIVAESRAADYDPFLVAAVIFAESTFHSTARSVMGARGLMQIRPQTAAFICALMKMDCPSDRGLHAPRENIRVGIAYLKHLGGLYDDDMKRVLIAYNWGPGNLQKALAHSPTDVPEASDQYARKVTKYYRDWKNEFEPLRAALFRGASVSMQG